MKFHLTSEGLYNSSSASGGTSSNTLMSGPSDHPCDAAPRRSSFSVSERVCISPFPRFSRPRGGTIGAGTGRTLKQEEVTFA